MQTSSHRALSLRPRVGSAALDNPRAALTGEAAVEQLADDMRFAATRLGNATREDMSLLGWKYSQLTEHEAAARERAYALEQAN